MIYKHRNIIVLGEDNKQDISISLDMEKIARYSLSNVNVNHPIYNPIYPTAPPAYPPSQPSVNWSIKGSATDDKYLDLKYDYIDNKWKGSFTLDVGGFHIFSPDYLNEQWGVEKLEVPPTSPELILNGWPILSYVPGDNIYDIVLDISNPILYTYTIRKSHNPGNLFLIGSHNEWNNSEDETLFPKPTHCINNYNGTYDAYQLFTKEQPNLEFKWIENIGRWDKFYGDGSGEADQGVVLKNSGGNALVKTPGYYKITIDLNHMTWESLLIDQEYEDLYDQTISYDDVKMTVILGTKKSTPPIQNYIEAEIPSRRSGKALIKDPRGSIQSDAVLLNTGYLKTLLLNNNNDRVLYGIMTYANQENDNIGVSSPIFLGELYTRDEIEDDLVDTSPTPLTPAKDSRMKVISQIRKSPYEDKDIIYNSTKLGGSINIIDIQVRKDIVDILGNTSKSFVYIYNIECDYIDNMIGEAIILSEGYENILLEIESVEISTPVDPTLEDPTPEPLVECVLELTIYNIERSGLLKIKLI